MNVEIKKIKIDEVEINIKNILVECIRKWKVVLVCAVVFGLLFTWVMYDNQQTKYKRIYENAWTEQDENTWTEQDKMVIDSYEILQQKMNQLSGYMENSLILKLDFSNVNQAILNYQVDANEIKKYDVANALANYVNQGALASALSEKEEYGEAKYVQEILQAEIAGTTAGIESGVVTITILAETGEECIKRAKDVAELVQVYIEAIKDIENESSIHLIQKDYVVKTLSSVYTMQKNFHTEYATTKNEYMASVEKLTDLQIAYILSQNNELSTEFSGILGVAYPRVNIMAFVTGAFLGIVFACIMVVVATIFGGRIQSDKEILKRLGICHLGNVSMLQDKGLDSIVAKLYGKSINRNSSVQLNEIASRLQVIRKNSEVNNVILIGTSETICGKYFDKRTEYLQNYKIVGNILENHEHIQEMEKNTNVILVETVGRTKVKDLYDEALLCLDANVNVVGYICIYV